MEICIKQPPKPPQIHKTSANQSQKMDHYVYEFVSKKINKKRRVIVFLIVQISCFVLAILVILLLKMNLSYNFILAYQYSPLALAYCTTLIYLYINLSQINLVFSLQILSLAAFLIFMTFYNCLYFQVFQPIFAYEFNYMRENCKIIGVKVISLHENEKYSIIYTVFKNEKGDRVVGQACASNNRNKSIFETNIQPYQFIYYSDLYTGYNEDWSRHAYTFSQLKMPTWFCIDDIHLQAILNNPNEDSKVFPFCRINPLQNQVGHSSQQTQTNSVSQADDALFIVLLSQNDPYFDQTFFLCLIVFGLFPLIIFSSQIIVLLIWSKVFFSFEQWKKLQKSIAVINYPEDIKKTDTKTNKRGDIKTNKMGDNQNSSAILDCQSIFNQCSNIDNRGICQTNHIHSSKQKNNNTQTQTITQPIVINQSLNQDDQFQFIFNEQQQLDNSYYFKDVCKDNSQINQIPTIQHFLQKYPISVRDEKEKARENKFYSVQDIQNQSFSISYFHENNLLHLEQYDIPNPPIDNDTETIKYLNQLSLNS